MENGLGNTCLWFKKNIEFIFQEFVFEISRHTRSAHFIAISKMHVPICWNKILECTLRYDYIIVSLHQLYHIDFFLVQKTPYKIFSIQHCFVSQTSHTKYCPFDDFICPIHILNFKLIFQLHYQPCFLIGNLLKKLISL